MLVHRVLSLAGIIASLSTPACHRNPQVSGLVPVTRLMAYAPPEEESVMLEVENHNWSDINVYILHDGRKQRFATVTAAKDASLNIPKKFQGDTGVIQLMVYRIGGQDSYTSDPISLRTGYTVRLTVESSLSRSSVGVW